MSSPFFRFKQFTIRHDRCAMKVGTDGVLLGAWAMLDEQCTMDNEQCAVLDIGTGSGLVALMLVQRFAAAHIDAIDIEPSAVEQARMNFSQSPWAERLNAHLAALQDWQPNKRYNLIVSNPPYFQNSLKNPDKGRELARHTDSLPYDNLLRCTSALLAPRGIAAFVLPAQAETEIIRIAKENGLYCSRLTRVHSKPGKPAKRILIEFSPTPPETPLVPQTFYIESATSPRSEEYAEMTKDFYL